MNKRNITCNILIYLIIPILFYVMCVALIAEITDVSMIEAVDPYRFISHPTEKKELKVLFHTINIGFLTDGATYLIFLICYVVRTYIKHKYIKTNMFFGHMLLLFVKLLLKAISIYAIILGFCKILLIDINFGVILILIVPALTFTSFVAITVLYEHALLNKCISYNPNVGYIHLYERLYKLHNQNREYIHKINQIHHFSKIN